MAAKFAKKLRKDEVVVLEPSSVRIFCFPFYFLTYQILKNNVMIP